MFVRGNLIPISYLSKVPNCELINVFEPEIQYLSLIHICQGGWLTTAHMRSANIGFISGAKLVFYAGKSFINSGYHIEMHGEIFKAWFVRCV